MQMPRCHIMRGREQWFSPLWPPNLGDSWNRIREFVKPNWRAREAFRTIETNVTTKNDRKE